MKFHCANVLDQGLHLHVIFSQARNYFPSVYKLRILSKKKDQYFKRAWLSETLKTKHLILSCSGCRL